MPTKTDLEVPAPPVISNQVTEADMAAIRNNTRAMLDLQPKVSVRLPKSDKNAPNFETVQINGHTFQIMRGTDVMVPQAVKDILVEANII